MATAQLGTLLRHIHKLAGGSDHWTDRQLLDDFAARRDETAFATLVARHGPMVLRVCRRVLNHEQDAEDAFQATFLVLARSIGSIRKRETVANWLHGVAYRTAMKAKRSAARRRNHEARLQDRRTDLQSVPPTWDEVQAVLDEEIQRLPEPLRAAFVLRVLEDKSGPEAAAELSCKEGTVSSRLQRARRRLQSRLARRGIQLAAMLAALSLAEGAQAALPAGLARLAVRSGLLVAAGESTAALVTAHVAALAAGVTRAMFLTKAKVAVVILLAAGALAAFGLALSPASGEDAKPQQEPANAKQPAGKDDGLAVSGRVLGPDGKPFPGAKLYAPQLKKEEPTSPDDFAWTKKAETDADGRFRLTLTAKEMGPGLRSYVVAAAEGHGVDWAELSKDEKPDELTLRLVKDAPIKGRLLDTQGKPLAGVSVGFSGLLATKEEKLDQFFIGWKQMWEDGISQMSKRLYAPLDKVLSAATTDKDGRFEIRGAGIERVALLEIKGPAVSTSTLYVVVRPGFDPKPINEAVLGRIPAELRIPGQPPELYGTSFDYISTPTRIIEGTVRETDTGKPVSGVQLHALTGYGTGVMAVSDAQGHYKLIGVPKAKEYSMHAMPPKNTDLLSRSVRHVDDGGLGTIQHDIELARGVVVTGQILDKATGKGVKGGVRFAPLPDNKFFGKKPGYDSYRFERLMTTTESDGRFRLVVIPGAGVLMTQVWGGITKIDGQALNPYKQAQFEPAERERVKPTLNGEDWVFTAAGNSLEFLNTENAVKVLDLAEGAGSATANLFVDPGKTLKIHIQDADGKPLPGVIASGVTTSWPITFTLKAAECTICALDPEQPRQLVFLHPKRNLAGSVTVRGDEEEAPVVQLKPTGSITGRLLDLDGQPLAGVEIDPSADSRAISELYRHMRQQRQPMHTDKDGRFRLEGLVPEVKFSLGLRKGRTSFVGEPRIGLRQVESGKTLDLGEVRVKPFR